MRRFRNFREARKLYNIGQEWWMQSSSFGAWRNCAHTRSYRPVTRSCAALVAYMYSMILLATKQRRCSWCNRMSMNSFVSCVCHYCDGTVDHRSAWRNYVGDWITYMLGISYMSQDGWKRLGTLRHRGAPWYREEPLEPDVRYSRFESLSTTRLASFIYSTVL